VRGLWFAAGVGAGVYGMVKARRVQEALTPDGLRDRGRSLALGARMIRDEVAQGRVDKEHELRDRLGLPPLAASRPTPPQLTARTDNARADSATATPARTESRGHS
jgi:hypothetical protein